MSNLLEPITLEEGEADKFIDRHRCGLCLGHLIGKHAAGRKIAILCPEHGEMFEHTVITIHTADDTRAGRRAGSFDLRTPPNKSADEILKELGYD